MRQDNKKIIEEWLEKAEDDYGFANSALEFDDYFSQICFHFHQAAEKYLKVFIIAKRQKFRPVHNLIELLEICRKANLAAGEIEEYCRFLNPFYIETRYPVHWPVNYDKKTAIEAKKAAKEIRDWVSSYLATRRKK